MMSMRLGLIALFAAVVTARRPGQIMDLNTGLFVPSPAYSGPPKTVPQGSMPIMSTVEEKADYELPLTTSVKVGSELVDYHAEVLNAKLFAEMGQKSVTYYPFLDGEPDDSKTRLANKPAKYSQCEAGHNGLILSGACFAGCEGGAETVYLTLARNGIAGASVECGTKCGCNDPDCTKCLTDVAESEVTTAPSYGHAMAPFYGNPVPGYGTGYGSGQQKPQAAYDYGGSQQTPSPQSAYGYGGGQQPDSFYGQQQGSGYAQARPASGAASAPSLPPNNSRCSQTGQGSGSQYQWQ